MHYYKRNIGDYHKKAGRLSIIQHGVYCLLLDACYDRETFPTEEEAIDWVWASTDEEISAVKFVLKKFFQEEGGHYVQRRIKDDLEKYHANAATNKRIAIEREAKRKEESTKRKRSVNEASPNHKPITINQEPLTIDTKAKRFSMKREILSLGVSEEVAAHWMTIRKNKKAANTQLALDNIQREADKAGLTIVQAINYSANEGWSGFKAEWVKQETPQGLDFIDDIDF